MGIDFRIKSTIDNEWNEQLGSNAYCKWAWAEADIEWTTVFSWINFNPQLLFDNEPNFWTWEHLQVVLDNLIKLKTTPEYYAHEYSGVSLSEIKAHELSIIKLIELFQEYVDKKCHMIIF